MARSETPKPDPATPRKVPAGFKKFEGSRAQVMNGTAYKTARGEKAADLIRNDRGSIVNKVAAEKASARYWAGVEKGTNPLALWSQAVGKIREKRSIDNFSLESTFAKGSTPYAEARQMFNSSFTSKTKTPRKPKSAKKSKTRSPPAKKAKMSPKHEN